MSRSRPAGGRPGALSSRSIHTERSIFYGCAENIYLLWHSEQCQCGKMYPRTLRVASLRCA